MLRTLALTLLLPLLTLPPARLTYMRAVTEPLFQCDTAAAPVQLTLCPDVAHQIEHTRIPGRFHGAVRRLALQLRSVSAQCAWTIRAGALRFLRTSQSIYQPAVDCEGRVADVVTRFYAAR